ncbi:MAG TPA: gluconokinase, GntK/IdnK-type [Pirellulaceae bacterium]
MNRVTVIMGVSGSGKSTVGRLLAARWRIPFVDADDFHTAASRHKMRVLRQPLTDEDRLPWLTALADRMHDWNRQDGAVVACSALKRAYRARLERDTPLNWVYLRGERTLLVDRLAARTDHFFPPDLLDSQLRDLEEPSDALTISITESPSAIVEIIASTYPRAPLGIAETTRGEPLVEEGGVDEELDARRLAVLLDELIERRLRKAGRILLIPPDASRHQSQAGQIVRHLWHRLSDQSQIDILPALGTHGPLDERARRGMFGDDIPASHFATHQHRSDVRWLGRHSTDDMVGFSEGKLAMPMEIEAAERLFQGYDEILSIGQVVPHEVAGMANYTKNVVIGVGGKDAIDKSHFLGAVCGLETIMGQLDNPVRRALDAAFDRFVRPRLSITFVLTVVESQGDRDILRGLFCGSDRTTFEHAARLSQRVNIVQVDRPLDRCVVYLDPRAYRSTWLGNKAIYRMRRAMADGGELIILAPGIEKFGENPDIDQLIRRHGYCGTPHTLQAIASDPELANNLAAAAHLIHGSTEGRFDVTYCPAAGLSRDAVESVGFHYRPANDAIGQFDPARLRAGWQTDLAGRDFYYVPSPGMGLWIQ